VRFADFKTISRSLSLPAPTNITQELLSAGIELLTTRLPPRHLPVRLLGFGVTNLGGISKSQQQLFDRPDQGRHRELDQVADQIAARYGASALRRGTRLEKGEE